MPNTHKKSIQSFLFAISLILLPVTTHAVVVELSSANNQVTISPQDFQIKWNNLIVNSPSLKVNNQDQTLTDLEVSSVTSASWMLNPSKIHVNATLKKNELIVNFTAPSDLKIKRNRPIVLAWFNLDEGRTDTLFLPFSEGMRIPVKNEIWASYLADNYSGANTTQELKMPFWTAQQKNKYISYQLIEATNNQLNFSKANSKVDMYAEHHFTSLNQSQPFSVSISIGDSWLEGAKTYRQWRIEKKISDPLTQKVKRNPNIIKIIGASQVYLFGKDFISIEDVTDWWGLKNWYIQQSKLSLPKEAKNELQSLSKGKDWFSKYHKQLLLDSISTSLNTKYNVPIPTLSDNTISVQYHAAQQRKIWLEEHASPFLKPSKSWGQALSLDMVANLKKAGLNKLWLGFDNWMPAFYQPDVVDMAKNAGYLVATYDSYNTAIPAGENDDWLTARLPEKMRKKCAIELADKSKKKGFRGNGYYLNPNCHFDYVKKRVLDIAKYGRFNSLFIDVDATAMSREDYRDSSNESDMLEAFNDRMEWISKQGQLVLGSEDGNSLTTRGISFAHGLESVGFGWVDKDMKSNAQSPYYLGRWYPDHKPDFFFKPAQVKEPYKSLFFSPQFRIPLYQTVFHDEVINSHHWHSDSLKFIDVKAYRDLTAMLYNTPPMVHLTRDEASSDLTPRVQALKHYQDGFQPIHEQLWDKTLVDFIWLDQKGYVQQTTFDDGSKIVANFSENLFTKNSMKISPLSIKATLSNGKIVFWRSK
ncbi:glycoside hydrolase [Aliivibrio kagoshimensis]|uniref:glycoside hydrolase n=1 Tax=Aliivibrio kagoshimensis TaxID=2910230 RepID=UPI003D12EAD4